MEYRVLVWMLCVSILLLLTLSDCSIHDGYKVLRIGPLKNKNEVKTVQELLDRKTQQITVLSEESISVGRSCVLLVSSPNFHKVKRTLREHQIHFSTGNRKFSRSIRSTSSQEMDVESVENDKSGQTLLLQETLSNHGPDPVNSYLTFDEQISWIEEKVALSDVAQLYWLSETHEGRSIPCVMINYNQPTMPLVWIDANVRACDWITSAVALFLIDQILNGESDDPVFMRSNFRVMIAPNVNPDGYEHSRLTDRKWIKNRRPNSSSCIGVDLTKNFPVNFGVDGSTDEPCFDNYHGPYHLSEAETRGIDSMLEPYRDNLKFYFSLQAYGQQWLLPFAYTTSHPADYSELERVANMSVRTMQLLFGNYYEVGAESDFTGKISGTPYDYAKIYYSIPYSYTIRLPPKTEAEGGVDYPPNKIKPCGQEILAGIAEACRQARVLPQHN